MKKAIKATKNFIYNLSEEDKKAIERVYDLLDEIENNMDIDDILKVNDGELFEFQYGEIEEMFNQMMGFLEADSLNITKEIEEESEV